MAQFSILAIGPITSLLLVQAAHAQSGACDQLKLALAARIDPGIRGYALEAVPADAPVPPGAKVIGTCEGGARKILFHRSGRTPLSTEAAVGPASAPRASAAPAPTSRRSVQVNPASQPASSSVPIAEAPVGSSTDEKMSSLPKPNAEAQEAWAPGGGDAARVAERAAMQATVPQPEASVTSSAPFAEQSFRFLRRHWHWLSALVLVMLGGSLWAWLAHRSAYDAAGLPRGPRINSV